MAHALNEESEVRPAIAGALELVARRLGALTLSVVTPPEGARSPAIQVHLRSRPGEDGGPGRAAGTVDAAAAPGRWQGTLLAAPALVVDRSAPLVLGAGGEAPLSRALVEVGARTLAIAPIRTAQSPSGALVASAPEGTSWGPAEFDLLGRLAEMVAQRLQAAELLRLQRRRIAELAGLAQIAQAVQSTVDVDRLFSGFARALHELEPLRALHVARLDDHGAAVGVTTIESPGDGASYRPASRVAPGHPWFALRGAVAWSRGSEEPPPFIEDHEQHGVIVPLRSKGRVLGVCAVVTDAAATAEQVALVEQAVGQLALALDSVSLYQQATQRAARIQVLGNLARIVASVVDLSEAFDAFAEEVRWLIPFDRAVMLRVGSATGLVEPTATYPHDPQVAGCGPRALDGSAAQVVLEAERPVLLHRFAPDYAGLDWSVFGEDVTEVAAVPVHHGETGVAIFAVAHAGRDSYSGEELVVLEEVGRLLAVSIERVQLFEHAEYSARHDLLTGLPNYRYLRERLGELETTVDGGRESALMLIDMDDLKLFNDTLGHTAGDRAIEIVGREIRAACRVGDFVARVGGDEFVVVMEGATLEAALEVAARVHESLRDAHHEIPGAPTSLRLSAGIATAPHDADTTDDLLQAADQAMYEAKFAGGGRTRTASSIADAERSHHRKWRARSSRVVETLVRAAAAGASDAERGALALAERYAVAVAHGRGASAEALGPLRMLVASIAAERLASPKSGFDRATAMLLFAGLRAEWPQREPEDAAVGAELALAAVELAWLQLEPPFGSGLDLEAALRRLSEHGHHIEPRLLEELIERARSPDIEQRNRVEAA